MNKPEPVIEIKNLHKSFGDLSVLEGVDIVANKGEVISLIGSSGSGKSTLLRCANLLENSQQGKIFFDGEEIKWTGTGEDRTPADANQVRLMRTNLSMVFQQFNLFPHLTVLENLTIRPIKVRKVSKSEAEIMARKYLDRVHIPEQAEKYPAELSGGQQQRVAIARSLCMESKILLFDEPTSALDPEMINEVLDVMVELADTGMTMVCVTHEMGFARKVADTMVFMDEGKIIEVAPPDKFFSKPESARCREFLEQILEH